MNQREYAFVSELAALLSKYDVVIDVEHGDDDSPSMGFVSSIGFVSAFSYTQWDQVTQNIIREGINVDLLQALQEYYKGVA